MQRRIILLSLMIIIAVVIVVIVFVSRTSASVSNQSAQKSNKIESAANATVALSTVQPSPTPTLSTDAQVAVGQAYDRPYSKKGIDIKVVKVATPPLISQEEAVQALTNLLGGKPFGNLGSSITMTATYGLVTEGFAGPSGWNGELNFHLSDGEVLDHIENRLMWVLDYGGVSVPIAGQSCSQAGTCTVPPPDDHAIYLIDAATKMVLLATSYNSDHF